MNCELCPPNRRAEVRDGGVTCRPCHNRLDSILEEIVDRYHRLDPSPGASGIEERRPPGFRSTPPLNLHVVALRDPRTKVVDPGDPACALACYRHWANRVRRERNQQSRRRGIEAERLYLANALDWITRQHWVIDFAAEVERVCAQLRAANGEPNPKPVAYCNATLDSGQPCRHPLFPPQPGVKEIECAGCGETYDLLAQLKLRLGDELAPPDTSAFHCACGHADSQHDNDSPVRPCNVRWCACEAYRGQGQAA